MSVRCVATPKSTGVSAPADPRRDSRSSGNTRSRQWLAAILALGQSHCVDYHVSDDRAILTPTMWVTPVEVDFGAAEIGVEHTATVIVANEGEGPLFVSFGLDDNPAFDVDTSDFAVGPGTQRVVTLAYTATHLEDKSALYIAGNDPTVPVLEVPLVGGALVPRLSLVPDPVDFEPLPSGCMEAREVVLENTGTAPLDVFSVANIGDGFSITGAIELPRRLQPGTSTTIEITVAPDQVALYEGPLWVDSDDPAGERTAELTALATESGGCD